MQHRLSATAAVILVLLTGAPTVVAQNVSDLLEQAIFAEETAGDLDAAIKLYQQIVDQAEANRPLVAKALYRMGECYRKNGDKAKAVEVYRRLVRAYPDQTKLATSARAKLAKLNGAVLFPSLNRIMRRQINDDGEGVDIFIDLDTGKLYTLPKGLGGNKGMLIWLEAQGIDAACETNPRGPGLGGFDMVVIPMANQSLEDATLTGIADGLSRGKPATPAMMTALGELPRMYGFKTREGSLGILHIIAVRNDVKPRHIKIRYKLLKHGKVDMGIANSRTVVEAFLAAAVAGRGREAIVLISPQSAVAHQKNRFQAIRALDRVKIKVVSVHANDQSALAITTEVDRDHGRRGPLVLTLIKQRGLWMVDDIDLRTPDKAKADLAEFLKIRYKLVERGQAQVGLVNARTVVEAFLAEAVAGRYRQAIELVAPHSAVVQGITDIQEIAAMNRGNIKVLSVHANDHSALAITTEVHATHGFRGPLVLTLIKQRGLWMVDDIDLRTPDKLKANLVEFLRKHPAAKAVTAGIRPVSEADQKTAERRGR